jgi:hypothetical protein
MTHANLVPRFRIGDLILTRDMPTGEFNVGVVVDYDPLEEEFDATFVCGNSLCTMVVFRRDMVIAR